MLLINPDVIAEARGLSIGASGFLLFLGFLLWAFGWRWHRFWVVFAITLTAGILGLSAGQNAGVQILVVGVLSAIAAGMLALEIARILSFVTGGVAAWLAATAVAPSAQELWAVFLCGGLLGVVLYKLWTMIAMSVLGILICWHTLVVMGETLIGFDGSRWALENAAALNGAVVVGTLLGVFVQVKTGKAEGLIEAAGEDKSEKNSKRGGDSHEPTLSWMKRIVPLGKAA